MNVSWRLSCDSSKKLKSLPKSYPEQVPLWTCFYCLKYLGQGKWHITGQSDLKLLGRSASHWVAHQRRPRKDCIWKAWFRSKTWTRLFKAKWTQDGWADSKWCRQCSAWTNGTEGDTEGQTKEQVWPTWRWWEIQWHINDVSHKARRDLRVIIPKNPCICRHQTP